MMPTGDTLVMVWLAALVAPPIIFGIWMRVKLMLSEEGSDFLVEREIAKTRGEWETPHYLRDQFGDTRGKAARATFDFGALVGSHGDNVATLLARAVPFIVAYAVYAAVISGAGYLWLL